MFFVINSYSYDCRIDGVLLFIVQETVRNLDEAAIAAAASVPVATFASPTAVKCVLAFHFHSFQKVLFSILIV